MNATLQETEFLFTQYVDPDGQMPTHWDAHPITKRTKEFVFVQYRIGVHYRENLRLRRKKLETDGEIYWSHGTLVRCFYTAEKKNRIDALYKTRSLPGFFQFFGLQCDAKKDDLKRAYKRMARQHHPDAGGSNSAFQSLQAQYKTALVWFGMEDVA